MYIDKNCIWTKYGTDPVQDILVDSDSVQDRIKSAKNHYGLDKLILDKEWSVRRAVAKEGFGLDILINDPISLVRVAVVRQGYRLDKLLNDKDIYVYNEVQNYLISNNYKSIFDWAVNNNISLDIEDWSNSKDASKRYEVVKAKLVTLDKFVDDEDVAIRYEVARQGYGLDILINDDSELIVSTVIKYLTEHRITLEQWIEQNGKTLSSSDKIKEVLKEFIINKIDNLKTISIQTNCDSIDDFFNIETIQSYEQNDYLNIITADTKNILFKIEKALNNDKKSFNFIVNITTDDGETYNNKTIISSKSIFNNLIKVTVDALRNYPQYYRYLEDLEEIIY